MNRLSPAVLLATVSCLFIGCRNDPEPNPPPQNVSLREARAERRDARSLALDVQSAADAPTEADALRRLRQEMLREGYTYEIRTYGLESGRLLEAGSVTDAPVRTEVQIFRGREPVHSFAFIPKDNRNLALLGQ